MCLHAESLNRLSLPTSRLSKRGPNQDCADDMCDAAGNIHTALSCLHALDRKVRSVKLITAPAAPHELVADLVIHQASVASKTGAPRLPRRGRADRAAPHGRGSARPGAGTRKIQTPCPGVPRQRSPESLEARPGRLGAGSAPEAPIGPGLRSRQISHSVSWP